jgi:uncharacterized protein YijF (DUF1287 family)
MESNISNELLFEQLKRIHMDMTELKTLKGEMRAGFASMRQHFTVQQSDQHLLEERILALETETDRIKRRLDIVD